MLKKAKIFLGNEEEFELDEIEFGEEIEGLPLKGKFTFRINSSFDEDRFDFIKDKLLPPVSIEANGKKEAYKIQSYNMSYPFRASGYCVVRFIAEKIGGLVWSYPRKCFTCKVPISYRDSLQNAEKNLSLTKEEFVKIWKSKRVQILCCNCYKKRIKKSEAKVKNVCK